MRFFLASAAVLTLSAPALADQRVEIAFAAEIGGKPFSCQETYAGLGAAKTEVSGIDYRLFLHDAALIRADGVLQPIALDQDGLWQRGTLALLDFEDGSGGCSGTGNAPTNRVLRGSAPEGEYVGLSFQLGVPFEMNHVDPTLSPAPLNTTGMFWNWQNGFRFLRVDLVPTERAEDGPKGWFLHLGSTRCAADSKTEAPSACADPNRPRATLAPFDFRTQSVVIDPAPVIAGADLRINAPETSPGCMSFPGDADCETVMSRLGLAYGDRPAGPQLLFSAR